MAAKPKAKGAKSRNMMATIADLLRAKAAGKMAPPPGFSRQPPAMVPGGGAAPSPMSMMPGAGAMTQ